jgi:hypothetical protein
MTAILVPRMIGAIPVEVVLTEGHRSSLGITSNPIETGAEVTDHAYVKPKQCAIEFADGNAAATYQALVRFQESRVPFIVVTGLYVYRNMLIETLVAERDNHTSKIVKGTAELREVVIVSTVRVASAGEGNRGQSGQPGGTNSTRAATPDSSIAGNSGTADRVASTVTRGDQAAIDVAPAQRESILRQVVGAQ